jgi:hypothetical protein
MSFMLLLMSGLFMHDNAEFFATAEKQVKDGYSWEYVGKQPTGDVPSLPVLDKSGKEVIYFRLTK